MRPLFLRQQIKVPRNQLLKFRKFLFLFGIITVLAALLGVGLYVWLHRSFHGLGPLQTEIVVIVPKGASAKRIAGILKASGVIHDANVFQLGLKFFSGRLPLRAGEFMFSKHGSAADVINILQSGSTVLRKFTVAEGLSNANIAKKIRMFPGLKGSVEWLPEEGWLLPETYNFSLGDSRHAIIKRMNKAMIELLAELWSKRSKSLPFKSPKEALILASIVEKETGISTERSRVAAVFINRMRKGMRLQSDPTIIYGLTKGKLRLGRALTYKDLREFTPYNTYLIDRLPPTAIANPGKAALQAVLHPIKSEELYFVADGSGGHAFSKTLKEHNRNVSKWRNMQK